MTEERLVEIFDEMKTNWKGDNAFQGLMIMAKYFDPMKKDLIVGADHDVIYSLSGEELIEAGLTEEDAIALAKLNWSYNGEYFECYV